MAPDFDTKEKGQALAGVNLEKEIAAKLKFKETLEKEWHAQAKAKGLLDEANRKDVDLESSYFKKK
jgi:nitrite reductase (cytochrome c-552)